MNKEFNKGLLLAGFGSFWWGFFGENSGNIRKRVFQFRKN